MKNILIFYFLVGVGWGTEGAGTDGDSPEGKTALSTPTASLASQVQSPSSTSHCAAAAKYILWLQAKSWFGICRERMEN